MYILLAARQPTISKTRFTQKQSYMLEIQGFTWTVQSTVRTEIGC